MQSPDFPGFILKDHMGQCCVSRQLTSGLPRDTDMNRAGAPAPLTGSRYHRRALDLYGQVQITVPREGPGRVMLRAPRAGPHAAAATKNDLRKT